jgi:hypothetical protein
MDDRSIDSSVQRGYNKRAEFKLHNYTEKTERKFFEAVFPWYLLEDIAS